MALVWQARHDGVHYQLKRRGNTQRLFANGVQHSEFHPRRLVTGSVWDLLWLPALFHDPSKYRRVLVLGLGGGTLVPPIRELVNPGVFVAVEKDPLHLEVAERFFAVGDFGAETVLADAVTGWPIGAASPST
jgi:spermidine synthase